MEHGGDQAPNHEKPHVKARSLYFLYKILGTFKNPEGRQAPHKRAAK